MDKDEGDDARDDAGVDLVDDDALVLFVHVSVVERLLAFVLDFLVSLERILGDRFSLLDDAGVSELCCCEPLGCFRFCFCFCFCFVLPRLNMASWGFGRGTVADDGDKNFLAHTEGAW